MLGIKVVNNYWTSKLTDSGLSVILLRPPDQLTPLAKQAWARSGAEPLSKPSALRCLCPLQRCVSQLLATSYTLFPMHTTIVCNVSISICHDHQALRYNYIYYLVCVSVHTNCNVAAQRITCGFSTAVVKERPINTVGGTTRRRLLHCSKY
jgi:hypothetical protein